MSTAPALIKCTLFFFLVASVFSKLALEIKQVDICVTQLNNNLPRTCSFHLLTGNIIIPDHLSSEGLAELNAAYAKNCIPACVEPILQYYRCLSSEAPSHATTINFAINLLQNVYCGRDGEEYCFVKFFRLNDTLPELETCPDIYTDVNDVTLVCNATTPESCYDDLSTFSSMLGCCATGFLPYRQDCNVTFDPPCGYMSPNTSTPTSTTIPTPTVSPANGLYPFAALSMIAFAILGLLF
ncbi:PREDICTED: uncharacterized protein LOC109593712 isoform X1 [Amphimedon queenslandica]|uniref:Uncharacterized protein n=1 Tax=Amphimedon queenslandica TaxID=400682 RepID=A0A1X7VP11_AMPQE|nr:PREDICTED: uncharacterized protein LOC109593712 isoform X1 [Amphimedon queenslandica]|eukprot:XP_019864240.1 PREDICTED: uncharacterized protein LOC109593712 isoform X1 [Amphimedon queenslandica]